MSQMISSVKIFQFWNDISYIHFTIKEDIE